MANLGYLIYPGKRSEQEDRLWFAIQETAKRLKSSGDFIDNCVGIHLLSVAEEWAEMIREARAKENQIDRDLDEQQ